MYALFQILLIIFTVILCTSERRNKVTPRSSAKDDGMRQQPQAATNEWASKPRKKNASRRFWIISDNLNSLLNHFIDVCRPWVIRLALWRCFISLMLPLLSCKHDNLWIYTKTVLRNSIYTLWQKKNKFCFEAPHHCREVEISASDLESFSIQILFSLKS